MELESGSPGVERCRSRGRRRVSDGGSRYWSMAREPACGGVRRWYWVLVHTPPQAWVGTLARTPVVTRPPGPHEESKPSVTEARRSAEKEWADNHRCAASRTRPCGWRHRVDSLRRCRVSRRCGRKGCCLRSWFRSGRACIRPPRMLRWQGRRDVKH